MMVLLVAMRENAVLMTIEKLQSEGKPISYESIALRLGCSDRTVQRAVTNLLACNILKRQGTPRGGYVYEVIAHAG